jgi:rubrerythrin
MIKIKKNYEMKHLKKFENFSDEEMDRILDKINDSGIESLSPLEKYYLNKGGGNVKDSLIDEISNKVEEYGGDLSMYDLDADSSPVYRELDQSIDLIETLYSDSVFIRRYGGYKYETELHEYEIGYDKLSEDTLIEINELLDDAIKNGLIEKDE